MKQAYVVVYTYEMHRGDDVPFIEGEKEAKEYGKENENNYEKQVRRYQQIRQDVLTQKW